MTEETEIGVDAGAHGCCGTVAVLNCRKGFPYLCNQAFRGNAMMGIYDHAEKLHASGIVLEVYLLGMKFETEVSLQKVADSWNHREEELFVTVNEIKVIDIAAVVLNATVPLYPLVENIEIDVAEKLRREVADGDSAAVIGIEQALVPRKGVPSSKATLDPAVDDWFAIDNQTAQPHCRVSKRKILRRGRVNDAEQTRTVDVHEVAADVELQDVAVFRVVARA